VIIKLSTQNGTKFEFALLLKPKIEYHENIHNQLNNPIPFFEPIARLGPAFSL
jgi:hypothetical protein